MQTQTVRRQAMWSNLAHAKMTNEFRGLCRKAYLQQELEKLQDLLKQSKDGCHRRRAAANNGEGPKLLRRAHDAGLEKSISELTAEVNTISSTLPPMAKYQGRSTSPIQAQSSGRMAETGIDEVSEVTSKLSTVQLEKVSASPALKLPQLFSLTPNSSGKGSNTQKRHTAILQVNPVESVAEGKSVDLPISNNNVDNLQGSDSSYVHNLRRSVRSRSQLQPSCDMDSSRDNHSYDGSNISLYLFGDWIIRCRIPTKVLGIKSKRLFLLSMIPLLRAVLSMVLRWETMMK
ncbi:hypothetical protein IFM89_024700 [Coptis chinensis]|uniref:Uncharacterized protein n=1 Tax=Coptis chinensis TaxID=261450 RepID=A0A835LNG0_9MAGN|nr:hypothetical protein IFM89_024700 [Coptis chinensis]